MKFILIFGPGAVGKMTVGQELAKTTGLKLFHNHMTIDLVSNFFNYSTQEGKRLVGLFRQEIFEAVAKSDLYGIIFTYMWAFDAQEDWDYISSISTLFQSHGAEICYVELEADFDERHKRNSSPNRLENKPTKRNLELSDKMFLSTEAQWRLNSLPGEITHDKYIRINTTKTEPEEAAKMIKEAFGL